ncbi:MAG: ATP-binding protein [Exilibacterium sp.]
MEALTDTNNLYLDASLRWLRLRLQQLILQSTMATPLEVIEQSAEDSAQTDANLGMWASIRRCLFGKGQHPAESRDDIENDEPSAHEKRRQAQKLEEDIRQTQAEMRELEDCERIPALLFLTQRFSLSDFERDTLLLCVAMELDPGLATLCAQAQGSASRNYPTFALALSLFDNPRWDSLAPQRPLRFARMIEINQPPAKIIAAFSKGALENKLACSQRKAAEQLFLRLQNAAQQQSLPIAQCLGSDVSSKLAVAEEISAQLQRQLFRVHVDTLPTNLSEIETLARLWQRENLLLPVALYIEAEEPDRADSLVACQHFLAREMGLVFLGVRENPLRLEADNFSVEIDKPTPQEQYTAWLDVFADNAETCQTARRLAGQFDLNYGDIRTVTQQAELAHSNKRNTADGEEAAEKTAQDYANDYAIEGDSVEPSLARRVWSICRELTRPRLDQLAQRIEPKATWQQLVLPNESKRLLQRILGQVRERYSVYEEWGFSRRVNRGMGISALFSGESGTGKTMAAEVIANELDLNLYRIDLSAVVSKYIGETEKNLRKLFDAAEQGGAILFFDEADALFGKRSEVKDSHDRYANIEINYLLQRMESFSGLAILASNMKNALDTAFMRRLRFVVDFQFPGMEERREIWEKVFPPETPKQDLDFERLARMNLSGGHIYNIALSAAFLATEKQQSVTMPILQSAALVELQKLKKPLSEAQFL